jgi:hypothetical protein
MEVATMTNHVARLYALATSLIVFFAVWLTISAHPWSQSSTASSAASPQTAALIARERQLRAETRRVNLIVNRRFAAYRKALARRNHVNAVARAQHAGQLTAARNAAVVASQSVASAPVQSSSVAAPAPVRIVTLPAVAATRTS